MPTQVEIGNQQYVFTADDGGRRGTDLFISAHGGYWALPELGRTRVTGWIKVPDWTTLIFYGPHKSSLLNPGLYNAISGGIKKLEEIESGKSVRNYKLSKFQFRRHMNYTAGREETYASIQADLKVLGQTTDKQFDVMAIRYRRFRISPSLNDVLGILGRWGRGNGEDWRYPRIHCIFCRSRMIGPDRGYDPLTGDFES